mgnify:CR=1 FL=1
MSDTFKLPEGYTLIEEDTEEQRRGQRGHAQRGPTGPNGAPTGSQLKYIYKRIIIIKIDGIGIILNQ